MKNKYFYVDFIRIFAAFLVILLHTTGLHLTQWKTISRDIWMTENVYDSFTRVSVPIFIMLSGALLLNKQETLKDFFSKRLSKLLIPFIVWIIVYIFWRVFFISEHLTAKAIMYMVFKGPVYYHLWYLYMLVGLYLITPFVRKITTNSTNRELLYLSFLWIIFVAIMPTLLYILRVRFNHPLEIGITIPFLAGHVGYFIIGNLINRLNFKKSHIILCWLGTGICFLVTTFGTLYFAKFSNGFDDVFYSYFSPSVVFQAICMFILLRYYGVIIGEFLSSKKREVISSMGDASLGVYLVHPIFLDLLLKGKLFFPKDLLNNKPLIGIPLATIVVTICSFIFVLIIMKVPILNLIVGVSLKKKKISEGTI